MKISEEDLLRSGFDNPQRTPTKNHFEDFLKLVTKLYKGRPEIGEKFWRRVSHSLYEKTVLKNLILIN